MEEVSRPDRAAPELVPAADPDLERAALAALERSGVGVGAGEVSPGYRSRWRVDGLAEGVDGSLEADRHALSPRSTRGATRA